MSPTFKTFIEPRQESLHCGFLIGAPLSRFYAVSDLKPIVTSHKQVCQDGKAHTYCYYWHGMSNAWRRDLTGEALEAHIWRYDGLE